MNDKELMVIEDEQTAVYAGRPIDRDLVVEFADTLMGVHPQAQEVGVQGMRTVAQLALITGANPLPGTNGIHAWKDNKGKVCIQFGVGFWRSQAELEGGRLWTFRPRPMDDQEREYYGIAKGQTASICSGAMKRDVFGLMHDARELGIEMSIKDAKGEVSCIGVGVVNGNEYDANGRTKQWKADLRAERDLLRQLVPVMQRARQNVVTGQRFHGGLDWSVGNYVRGEAPELPDDYDSDDANRDLGLDDDWDEVVFDAGDDVIDVMPESDYDLDDPPSDGKTADLRASLEAANGNGIQLGNVNRALADTGLYNGVPHAMNAVKLWPGWEDVPYSEDDINGGLKVKTATALQIFDWAVARKVEPETA